MTALKLPASTEVSLPPEVYLISEKRDEDQIIAEMKGEILSSYVYQIQQGNRTITNLSYAGVKEAVRRRGNFSLLPCECCNRHVHIDRTDQEVLATVKVWDLINNVQFIGVAKAPRGIFDYVLAVNKAERNAYRKLLPEKEIALLIEQFKRSLAPQPVPIPKEEKTVLPKVGLGPQRLDA